MALNWDATEVADFDNLTSDERQSMEMLLWATLGVGIQKITEANVDEFFARLSLIEKVDGAYRIVYSEGEAPKPLPFTKEDVRRFVGLRTNVSPLSKTKFLNRMFENHSLNVG